MTKPSADALLHFAERSAPAEGHALPGLDAVRYRLMRPERIVPGETYPLVIFMHGGGERGDDNEMQLKYLPEILARPENRERYPCFVVAPQCPIGRQWIEVPYDELESRPVATSGTALRMLKAACYDVFRSEPIDDARIYLTGISMGGFGCWYLASFSAGETAAAAPICGGGYEGGAAELKDLPIWAVHGARDEIVPVERSRNMIAAIRAAGGSPRYTELADVGHHSWQPAYEPSFGLLDWLFAQRRVGGPITRP
ncbi:MAG: phospholipase [Planctomycetia bacterium]|nr:phospholipase [Planctomycetia bacterium]